MKAFCIVILLAFMSNNIFASAGIGDTLIEMKARDENLIVENKNEYIRYCTKKKKIIASKKLYKNRRLIKDTKYQCTTGFKIREIELTYHGSPKSLKRKTRIKRYYWDNGNLHEEYKTSYPYKVYTKTFNEDGSPRRLITFYKDSVKEKERIIYNKQGKISIKQLHTKENIINKWYKKGRLVKEAYYMLDDYNKALSGPTRVYDSSGTMLSETFYYNNYYLYSSNCQFHTASYIKKLEKKYNKYIDNKEHGDIKCQELSKSTYLMVVNYVEESKRANTLLAVIDTDKQSIKKSFLNKRASVNEKQDFSLANYSYLSYKEKSIFNVFYSYMPKGSDETEVYYDTYKVDNSGIKLLKKPTFGLKDIENRAKKKEHFSQKELYAMLAEVPISKKSVVAYNNIAYYLNSSGQHVQAYKLLDEILDKYPKRAIAYLNSADAFLAVDREKDALSRYRKYIELMKKQGKESIIVARVVEFVAKRTKICLSPKNITSEIVNIEDDEMDKIIFNDKEYNILAQVKYLKFTKVSKRYFYKDLDFDGAKELLVDISSNEQRVEYKVYSIKCDDIVPFSLKTINAFKLNYKDKTLIEYTKDEDNKPIINTYCSDARDGKYYLCNKEQIGTFKD